MAALTCRLDALSGNASALSDDIKALTGDIDAPKDNAETLTGKIAVLKTDVDAMPCYCGTLTDNACALNCNAYTLNGNVYALKDNVFALTDDVETLTDNDFIGQQDHNSLICSMLQIQFQNPVGAEVTRLILQRFQGLLTSSPTVLQLALHRNDRF